MLDNTPISPRACAALGTVAAAIGISASAVGGWYFVLGQQALEHDAQALQAAVWAGVLLTLGGLAAFGLSALLPRAAARRLRVMLLAMGAMLFAAEVATMTVTQLALVQRAGAAADASASRAQELRRAIDARRATAQRERELSASQQSAGAITAAARALQRAAAAEDGITPLAAELAALEAAQRPTLATLLGPDHLVVFVVTRSALIAALGLVMMSAAGALFRAARGARAAAAAAAPAPTSPALASAAPAVLRPLPVATGPHRIHGRLAAAAVPLAALAGLPMATAAPVQPEQQQTTAAEQPAPAPAAAAAGAPAVEQPEQPARRARPPRARAAGAGTPDTGTTEGTDSRYRTVVQGVQSGAIKPSIRAIRAAIGGGSTEVLMRYLASMEAEGITVRKGKGYERAAA